MSTYLKRTDQRGKSIITRHEVWDLDRFLAGQQDAERKLADDGKDWCIITIATEQDYRDFAWRKKS